MTFPPWTWKIPEEFNIGAACTDAHLGTPVAERVAVICDGDPFAAPGAAARQATFAELARETNRFAELLRGLGIAPGARAMVRLPNCLEYAIVFLGALKHGAVAVPTSTQLTGTELLFVAADSESSVLVTDRGVWNQYHAALEGLDHLTHVFLAGSGNAVSARRVQVLDLAAALAEVSHWAAPHPTRAEDPAYIVYTSGTTGYPKGALHAHRALLGHQPASRYWFDFLPDGSDRVLHSGKYNWTYTLGTGLMDPLFQGATTIVHEGPADAAVWPRLIAAHRATIFIGVPTIYRQILQKTRAARGDVPTLRHCMSAGEPLSEEVLGAWRERFGQEIFEGLGMTECSYYISQPRGVPIRPGSAGYFQPGHDARLLDPETLQEVPAGAEGMICVPRDDPALLLRYWHRAEETDAAFRGRWFLTGDYARLDSDGHVWFLGRKDDVINTFGYRVSPYEVERVLRDHPFVADCAATAEEVAPGKTVVAVYVIPQPGTMPAAEDLIAYARRFLAAYKAPRIVHLVDTLPRTANGKVLRRALSPNLARSGAAGTLS